MSARLLVSLCFLVACDAEGARPGPGGAPSPTDETPTTDTGSDTGGTPTSGGPIAASCAVTDNALRVACAVELETAAPVRITYARADGAGAERVLESTATASEHALTLSLLAPEAEYRFVAETIGEDPARVDGTFTTGEPPELVAKGVMSVTGTSSVPYVGTHLPCESLAIAVIYDTRTGEVAWYGQLDANGTLGFMDMVRFTEDHTILGETGNKIVEMDLSGQIVLEMAFGQDYVEALHHDLTKRNGHVYALFEDASQQPGLDGFLVFDGDGVQVAEWWARDALEIPSGASGEFMHTNSIAVDASGDVYLSTLVQHSVLKVKGDWTKEDFGELAWALAGSPAPAGFGQDFAVDWSAVGNVGFESQHDITRLDDGRLLLLDNGHGRGLVIDVDEAAGTARGEAAYASGAGGCGPQGTTKITSEGNVFVACSEGPLREYTPDGDEVWEARIECGGAPAIASRFYPLEGW